MSAFNRRWGRLLATAATGIAVTTSIVACGNDDEATTTAVSGREATAVAAPSGEPIKVLTMGFFDAPKIGLKLPELAGAVEMRAKAINDAGGIGGRPVEVISCNFDGNPNRGTACANEAVENDVAAVVGSQSIGGEEAEYAPILEKAKIPVIGWSAGTTTLAFTSPVSFPFSSGSIGATVGSCLILAEQGAKKVSLVMFENPAVKTLAEQCATALGKAGAEIGETVTLPTGATDMAPFLAKASSGGVKDIAFAAAGPQMQSIISTGSQQGLTLSTVSSVLNPETLKSLGGAANGMLLVADVQPASADVPGAQQFRAEVEKYDPDLDQTALAMNFWLAAWTFERVAKDLDTVDASTVLGAMNELDGFDMGGLIPPYTTTKESKAFEGLPRLFNPTMASAKVEAGEIVSDGKLIQLAPSEAG